MKLQITLRALQQRQPPALRRRPLLDLRRPLRGKTLTMTCLCSGSESEYRHDSTRMPPQVCAHL